MKQISSKSIVYSFLAVIAISITFSSCKKNKEVEWPDAAVVTVVNASPKSPWLQFALDDNRLNLNDFSYTSYWNNQRAYIGNRKLSVYKYKETTPLFTTDITLEKDKHYTIFLADSASNMEAVVISNASRAASADSVRIKFANMSPDVPALDFFVKGETTAAAANVAYRAAADFVSLKAGYNVIIEARQAGSDNVLAASLPINLAGGNIYTIYSSGFKGIVTGEGRVTVSSIRHTQPAQYWY